MPIASRPDPLLTLAPASAGRPSASGPTTPPGRPGFADWLARAQPEPVRPPERPATGGPDRSAERRAEPTSERRPDRAPSTSAAPAPARLPRRPDTPPDTEAPETDALAATADVDDSAIDALPLEPLGAAARPSADAAPADLGDEATPAPGFWAAAGLRDPALPADGQAVAHPSTALPPVAVPAAVAPDAQTAAQTGGPRRFNAATADHPATQAVDTPVESAASTAESDEPSPEPSRRGAATRAAGRRLGEPTDPAARPGVAAGPGTPVAAEAGAALRTAMALRDSPPVPGGLPATRIDGATGAPVAAAGADPAMLLRAGSAPPAVTSAAMAPPLDHPDFAAALGAQVAVWARDGLHEAELRLNPASLGAVQVWIGVDAGQAQVRFTADLGSTRDALQAALPELAQALAREGLHLGGADVQTRQQRGEAPHDERRSGPRGARGGTTAVGLEAAPPRRLGRGLLDLYA